ncbi:MAG: GTPase HflX [SAR202 cluster bacterium]|nr:GTPase HflX [SAR202 cluster bacterium]
MVYTKKNTERVLLVGVDLYGRKAQLSIQDSIEELRELALSAGAEVIGVLTQKLRRYSHYYLGQGKLEELKELIIENSIGTVICDDELDPNQQQNLEKVLKKVKVIDRTALILDIFASRAQTREGRLQVELAQHEYLLPRLAGQWSHLERLGGGIGTRGPGETQIETDRRLIRNRIIKLKKELESIRTHRNLYRERRRRSGVDVVGLVGYTNAGKSTLLNTLTKAGVAAEDKLFMTLDPVTRKLQLPNSKQILITDTVGFIQKLPTTLVAAFRATLEEIRETSAILHVVDITHPNAAQHVSVVTEVLQNLGVDQSKSIIILNKADLLSSSASIEDISILAPTRIDNDYGTPVNIVSAKNGTGISELLNSIQIILED